MHKPKVILVVMDGWGYSPIKKGNAIFLAKTPNFDYLWKNYSHTLLNAFGESVGLPWGSIGSSEVGHTSIGTGRLINQELSLIDKEIESGNFYERKEIVNFIKEAKKAKRPLHLIGLVSDGGVHSQFGHLFALLKTLKANEFNEEIFIHAITDGRDTSPKSANQYIKELEKQIRSIGVNAKIATVMGRYYAMDRDSRWDRTKEAYLAMIEGTAQKVLSPEEAVNSSYESKVTDEFLKPVSIDISSSSGEGFLSKIFKNKKENHVSGIIKNGDPILFFNIRPDRMRQIVEMFLFPKNEIETKPLEKSKIMTLSTYNEFFPVEVAYPAQKISDSLAKLISDSGLKQGHFAETEKYAHVTYFFNGGNPTPHKNETWTMVASPKVATYDLKPEMSADELTDTVVKTIEKEKLDFVLINFANCDMVGHTGIFSKVVDAVEAVDAQIGRLREYLPETTLLITADHGNAECMVHPETGEIDKRHTVNPVPFVLVNDKYKKKIDDSTLRSSGILADITPTILDLLKIKKPEDMNGISLLDTLKP